jgi:glutamyl-tRNA synthetase
MSVRVRYAPSPTGLQHIGSIRTALYNYFFSRVSGGSFVLRIEDTDQERFDPKALQDIYDTFAWLGITWDEGPDKGGEYGPYIQSERYEIYQEYKDKLLKADLAYPCFCTSERLDQLRADQKKAKSKHLGYDRHCSSIPREEAQRRVDAGEAHVIRLKVPTQGKTSFHDEILGDVTRKNEDINPDPVLIKTDGFPTYHFAVVIDDHLMNISHILRAQEWIPSVPLHVQLYDAFGWTPPKFVHLPMVMGKDGSKLSKRHGSTAVLEFRQNGYLPEALLNYVTMVGWSYDDSREFFTKQEFEELFDISRINKAPGVFDYKKLDWFNGQYMRNLGSEDFFQRILPHARKVLADEGDETRLKEMVPLIQERLKKLTDAAETIGFVFQEIGTYILEELLPQKVEISQCIEILQAASQTLESSYELDDEALEAALKSRAEDMAVKIGSFLMPLRVAVTGTKISPPLIPSIRLVGLEKSKVRIQNAIDFLQSEAGK